MGDDADRRRRLLTPDARRERDEPEDGRALRRSRSPERREASRGSRTRHRSRSPSRRDDAVRRRSRSYTRHSGPRERRTRDLSRSRNHSRSPVRDSQHKDCRKEREVSLQKKCEKLEHLIDEIRSEQRRMRENSGRYFDGSRSSTGRRDGQAGQSTRKRTCPRDHEDERSKTRFKRSVSPGFSAKDVADILNSIKNTKPSSSQPQTGPADGSSSKLNHKNILPDFDPSVKTQTVDIWLNKVNECATVYGWDDKTIVHFAMQKLQGLAKTWYESLNSIMFTWPQWQDKLKAAFPFEQNYGQSLEDMLRRKSTYNEPIEVYYYEKTALLNRCGIEGKRAVECIIHGLSDKTMRSSANALRCSQPDQLLQFLMANKDVPQSNERPFFKRRQPMDGKPNSSSSSSDNKLTDKFRVNAQLVCYNCKEKGHPYLKCPKPLSKCTKCNRLGHSAEQCRVKPGSSEAKDESVRKQMCISSTEPSSKFSKEVIVNGSHIQAFVDFGSEVSLMTMSAAKSLELAWDDKPVPLKGFGNEIIQSHGGVSAELIVDGVQAHVKFQIVDDKLLDLPILVGQSFTELPHVAVFKDFTSLKFLNLGNEMPFQQSEINDDRSIKIKLSSCVTLSGPATVKVSTEPNLDGDVLISGKIMGKPSQQYIIIEGVYRVKKGLAYVEIVPISHKVKLLTGATLCRAEHVQVVRRFTTSDKASLSERKELKRDMIHVGECADETDRQRLYDILHRYRHCFAFELKELGCTSAAEMSIELKSKQPTVYRPYRLSHKEREEVRGMVSDMLEADVIRESVSEVASPIILVRKKDGKLRMCVDYRLLNSVTVKERYPMPVIEDEIARLSGQAYFITLDLASGYYQVPIAESSKPLTSFVTPDGQYEFNRMPFGLANAPAVFQRMMNRVLGSARYTEATAYMDDVLIYGKSKEECLNRLERILGLLDEANLTLNLEKCKFLQEKIDYLGYEISAAGVRPGDKKIQCVLDFPRPTNQHTVRQFLGLVGYFRKFIRHFAQIAHPLCQLLKKNASWCWNDEQENSFQALKQRLIERPILAIYDPTADTELHTDASKVGIGGILLQRPHGSGDHFRPVAFYSRQTTPEEKHFHAYELETLAVICSLKKFRVYLLGQEFKIVSDCSALRSTFSKRDIIPRIARWWLLLTEFQCSIEYRSGTKMTHVDALSRNPIPDKETVDALDQYPTVMLITSDDWLQTLQLGDTELERIRNILASDINVDDLKHIKDNYVIKDNKLYKCIDGDKENLRWVVPKGARWQVCRLNHDDIGHFGVDKTLDRIKNTYWFPKMAKFVKKYVGACVQCAYAKKSTQSKDGLLHVIEKVDVVFHTVHIDHLGPFVKSKRGNSHLLVVVEAFTKFVFIRPVRNTNTANAIRALRDIFYTFRFPDRLISDRGSCFTSHAFKRFCLENGIKHVLNAVASPRSNGQVERYNRSILDSLTAQNLNHDEKEWDERVGVVQWGLNNTKQKTTGRTPAEVMFGTSMNGEVDPRLNEVRQGNRDNNDVIAIREEVKDKIMENQIKQKEHFDKGRKPARSYKEGELVKITKVSFNNEGKSTKLMPSYIGPYRVVTVLGNDRYKVAAIPGLTGSKHKRSTVVAADRMMPWVHIAALEVQDSDSHDDLNNTESDNDD